MGQISKNMSLFLGEIRGGSEIELFWDRLGKIVDI